MNRIGFVALVLLLFAPLACQKNNPVDTSDVDPIARNILDAIAEGAPQSVYEAYFTSEYKSDMTPEEWNQIAVGYREMFGKVASIERLRGGAKWIEGQFIDGQVVYNVKWEKGAGEMTLDVTKADGWKVRQLRIESPRIDERLEKIKTERATQAAE